MGKVNESVSEAQKIFGSNLRLLRIRKNETQDMIGDLIELGDGTVSLIEQGKFKKMDLKVLIILSNHFGVSIDDMMKIDLSSPDEPDDNDRKRVKFSKDEALQEALEEIDTGQPQNKAAPPEGIGDTELGIDDLETEMLELLLKYKRKKNANK